LGIHPQTPKPRFARFYIKVFVQTFFKKFAGCGAEPHGLNHPKKEKNMTEKWSLTDIYPSFDSPEFLADYESLAPAVKKLNDLSGQLNTFEDAVALVRLLEGYVSTIGRLFSYAGYTFAADTENETADKYSYLLKTVNAETSRTFVRLAAFFAKQDDLAALAEAHNISEYVYGFTRQAESHKHLMSEDEETLTAQLTTTASSAWGILQEKLISSLSCKYKDPTKNGEEREIHINECRNLAYDPDPAVRKAAYEAELEAYPKIEESCAAALNSIKGEVNLLSRLRKYESPLAETLEKSAMTPKTLDALFQAIESNIDCFRDYMKAKAKYLAKTQGREYTKGKGLPFYDMFAPIGQSGDKTFTYDQAKAFVLENFNAFSPQMAAIAEEAFEKAWIDVYPRDGKVSGAFCGDIYAIKQFRILLNFGNALSDAITLAHELGHGYHSMQVMKEPIFNTNYPMPLAETASTFCELIVTGAALASMPDNEKLQLLENSIQDATQVTLDIYSRFLFEKSVFENRLDHPLSPNELKDLMLDAQKKAYGDGLDPDYLHPYMWVIKPHYYSAGRSYYNFPYAFGHLFAGGLYKIFTNDPDTFGEKYDNFLKATGKMSIKDSCALMGIDVEDAAFWNGAIDVIKKDIKEFERLTQ